jgi:hypothetical protein
MDSATIRVQPDGSLAPEVPTPKWLEWDGLCTFTMLETGVYDLKFTVADNLTFSNFSWVEKKPCVSHSAGGPAEFTITDVVKTKGDPVGVFLVDLSNGKPVDPSIANNPPG